ncbi:NAD(P)H-binding protein [Lunatibacter salilacus]|uniref:NAD(P)H-binding protein n=1 Tax=Lunatibacter salilacus TaxID=2483804 RepID=UPI00131B8A0A|nr:NAD(P)H-binding protein [Lunatibacter salilacus]
MVEKKPIVGILGLGWIGEPLARKLRDSGHSVVGTTTQTQKKQRLQESGISAKLLQFNPLPEGEETKEIFDVDILYINIPPSRRTNPDSFHPEQITQIRSLAVNAGVSKIIYVSATSVYPDLGQEAYESDELNLSNTGNPALWQAEQILWENKSYDLTVVRFGGLLGDNRIPGKYFSGKENVAGHPPANYVYRNDAVRAIEWIISQSLWNATYNVVAPIHPKKIEIYEENAKSLGFPPPKSYESVSLSSWKQISPALFLKTGFKFDYPDPLKFPYTP